MRDVTIQDYIGNKKELTAEQVKKLPVGSKVPDAEGRADGN